VNAFEPYPASGIWGLAYPSISSVGSPNIFTLLTKSNQYLSTEFSLCLLPGGGFFTIGGNYTSYPSFSFTPLTAQTYYAIELNDILVGTTSIGLPSSAYNSANSPTIVDSGSTLINVPSNIYSAIEAQFKAICTTNPGSLVGICGVAAGNTMFDGQCYSMTANQIAAYPTLNFNIGNLGANFPVPPTAYLVPVTNAQGTFQCLGIGGASTLVILGDVFMQNWNIVFLMLVIAVLDLVLHQLAQLEQDQLELLELQLFLIHLLLLFHFLLLLY